MAHNGHIKSISQDAWYPGPLAPNFFYVDGKLSGMAAGIPRVWGEPQRWEAFDMRALDGRDSRPVLLGKHDNLELAKRQVENTIRGATN